ncbi:hypothetical protein B0H13DRAFT_1864376 [Mycena leptocephala]|nr:hypothetical protein B0H13DRAFT_1864376 [Mycena leptocephala]
MTNGRTNDMQSKRRFSQPDRLPADWDTSSELFGPLIILENELLTGRPKPRYSAAVFIKIQRRASSVFPWAQSSRVARFSPDRTKQQYPGHEIFLEGLRYSDPVKNPSWDILDNCQNPDIPAKIEQNFKICQDGFFENKHAATGARRILAVRMISHIRLLSQLPELMLEKKQKNKCLISGAIDGLGMGSTKLNWSLSTSGSWPLCVPRVQRQSNPDW